MQLIEKITSYMNSDIENQQPFAAEVDLVDKFESYFDDFLSEDVIFEREFDCGFGVADAVVFKCKKKRPALGLSLVSPDWAYTLVCIPYRKNFDVEYVSWLSGASISTSKKEIKKFVASGFCQEKRPGVFIKVKQPISLSSSIFAIEAKLSNWKKAIWQATRYKIYANESWVVLDKKHSRPAILNIAEFEKYNVGLATISLNGGYDVHFTPKREMHKSNIAYWKANALLARKILN